MIWQEIKITTTHAAADAVANLFHDMGFGGVVIEDPQLVEEYIHSAGWDCYELSPEMLLGEQVTVKGYLPVENDLTPIEEHPLLKKLRQQLTQLWPFFEGEEGKITLSKIDEEDWAYAWKKYYHPEKITNSIVIKPSWELYEPKEGEIIVELDPGIAFGTGTHPTTIHCVRALERYIQGGERVIDVGTGSGILSIVAAKLGAFEVFAVDIDPAVISVAKKNIAVNQVEHKVNVLKGDLLEPFNFKADIIVGNLVASLVKRLAPSAWEKLKPGGIFIGAGIVEDQLPEVLDKLTEVGFKLLEITEEREWNTVVVSRG